MLGDATIAVMALAGVELDNLRARSVAELSALVSMVTAEQKRRALEAGDLEAIVEQAFESAFGRDVRPP